MRPVPRDSTAIRVARALGDPTRFRLLKAIAARGEVSCAELTARVRLSQATVSHHLKILADAGLVSVRRAGAFHYHRLERGALVAHGASISAAFDSPRRHASGRGR
jgi:ArsR family transcriptional regulator